LSRKVIVKNVAPSNASQIIFSYRGWRLVLDFLQSPVAGRPVFAKNNYYMNPGVLLSAEDHSEPHSLTVSLGVCFQFVS
jgi:hypothetical protein